ncbi:MAG: hypothetical protein ACTSVV_10495 [Promethearchaeota archaeon]
MKRYSIIVTRQKDGKKDNLLNVTNRKDARNSLKALAVKGFDVEVIDNKQERILYTTK